MNNVKRIFENFLSQDATLSDNDDDESLFEEENLLEEFLQKDLSNKTTIDSEQNQIDLEKLISERAMSSMHGFEDFFEKLQKYQQKDFLDQDDVLPSKILPTIQTNKEAMAYIRKLIQNVELQEKNIEKTVETLQENFDDLLRKIETNFDEKERRFQNRIKLIEEMDNCRYRDDENRFELLLQKLQNQNNEKDEIFRNYNILLGIFEEQKNR